MPDLHRYRWPASALTQDEMRMLYLARESHPDRPPITRLLREAVRTTYPLDQPVNRKELPHETLASPP